MIHESCFWLWLFYNNICFRLHTRIAEEIYWNLNYFRESGKKCLNLFFVEAIKNFLNETKKIRICLALPFLSPEFDRPFPTDEFCKCFLLFFSVFFFFFAARAYQRKKEFSYGSYLLLVNSPNDLGFTVFCEHSWITKNEIQRTSLRQYH